MRQREQLHHGSEGNVIRHMKQAGRAGVLLLAAVVGAACADDPAPLFEIPGSGSVEGQLFLDINGDGNYDPSAGDRLLPNVNVRLQERGTDQVIAGGTGTTDATGRFRLTGVPVGSHDLAIDTTGVGSGVAFCQNPVPVDVFLNETLFRPVAARGGCVISIAEAEAMPLGTPVTVRGVITSAPGMINSNTGIIQDASGGTPLFRFVGAPTLQVGDIAEVTGTVDQFAGEYEIVDVRVLSVTPGDPPVPDVMTTGAADATWDDPLSPEQGTLIRIEGAKLLTTFSAGGGRNATIDDGSGPILIRVESGLAPDAGTINANFTVNNCYNITGILRGFNADAQIMPRSFADIQEVPCQG